MFSLVGALVQSSGRRRGVFGGSGAVESASASLSARSLGVFSWGVFSAKREGQNRGYSASNPTETLHSTILFEVVLEMKQFTAVESSRVSSNGAGCHAVTESHASPPGDILEGNNVCLSRVCTRFSMQSEM